MTRENPWTDERKALLKLWWLVDQRTSTDIVELFHRRGFTTTRNAVIGAVHRSDWWEGMSRAKTPPKPKRPKREKREKKREKTPEPPPPPPVAMRTPPLPPPPELVPGQPMFLSVVQIGPNQCRYWYGESWRQAGRKNETGYCGHPTAPEHHSWCDAHLRLVYAKTPHVAGRISVPHKF